MKFEIGVRVSRVRVCSSYRRASCDGLNVFFAVATTHHDRTVCMGSSKVVISFCTCRRVNG